MKQFFKEIPCIKSENIELRALTYDDADALTELTHCEEVYRYLPAFIFEKKYDSAEAVIRCLYTECLESSLILGIFYDGEFCGLAEFYGYRAPFLKISIGYRLLPRFWGKGIASKVLGMMCDWLFSETNVKFITASVIPDNGASAKVLEKNGFKCAKYSVFEDWGYTRPIKTDKYIRVDETHSGLYSFSSDE